LQNREKKRNHIYPVKERDWTALRREKRWEVEEEEEEEEESWELGKSDSKTKAEFHAVFGKKGPTRLFR